MTEPYVVAVRALAEFTAKRGDLDLRFTPAPTSQQGMQGHATVASRRSKASYRAEVALAGEHAGLVVRGRADGFDAAAMRLEEVKTYRGDLDAMPMNHRALHRAQLEIYGALLCRQQGLVSVTLALVYFDIASQRETVFEGARDAAELQRLFEQRCDAFLAWARQEQAHRRARDAALGEAAFPYPQGFRAGQRALAEGVWRAAASGRCLLAQAPTGIGKTVGTLFPLLKACPSHGIDKVFFLTAKGSARRLALDAAERIVGGGAANVPQAASGVEPLPTPHLPLRVLELVAREHACEHPDKACHGESCPLARGFYDRLPAARAAAVAQDAGPLDRERLRALALAHDTCPYYLGQELVRWSDVIVGDYNHYFDLYALLHALREAEGWKVGLLVDEAHNLLDRARAMYTAELDRASLRALRRAALPPALARPLARLDRALGALARAPDPLGTLPDSFARTLQQCNAAVADHLADEPAGLASGLLAFHFDALHFARVAELFDAAHSRVEVEVGGAAPAREPFEQGAAAGAKRGCAARGNVRLRLRNLLPAPMLAPRLAAAQTAALFSATLAPPRFHADTLGLPESAAWIDVDSPFAAEQLEVRIVEGLSTRWADRAASAEPIAQLMARQFERAPGNYLAFFSSFDYLQQVADAFAALHAHVPQWRQARGMGAAEREAFLARFVPEGRGIGFAVLGGVFGEGIDLPGRRLIGAFVATLGLPPPSPPVEAARELMQARYGAGYDYAYLFPGVQKVVQAAGRVIRGPDDRGIVYLIDDRFARPSVRALLPRWWRVQRLALRDATQARANGDEASDASDASPAGSTVARQIAPTLPVTGSTMPVM